MRRLSLTLPAILLAAPAVAADLNVTVQIPQLNVAEYHRPYTAVWVEREDHTVAAQLAVWYAQKESKRAPVPSGCPSCASGGDVVAANCRCRWMACPARRVRPATRS